MSKIEEKINTAAQEYTKSLWGCGMYEKETPATEEDMAYAFKAGAKFALSHQWYNAKDKRPDHLQPCFCYNKFVGAVRAYVYDDISKYWCDQYTSEHDVNGYNHITDYADYDVTHWMPIPPLPEARKEEKGC